MELVTRLRSILSMQRHEHEVQWWMFSLAPLGVAFAFFFVFMLPMDLPNKDVILITGFAAGFAGLQTYWIFRGWTRGDGLTMLLGIISVIAVSALVWWYIDSLGDILRANSTVPWVYGYERSISGK